MEEKGTEDLEFYEFDDDFDEEEIVPISKEVDEEETEEKDRGTLCILLTILIVIIIIIMLLLRSCSNDAGGSSSGNKPIIPLLIEEDNPWDGNMTVPQENEADYETIDIPGYSDLYVSEEYKTIRLINPENNTVYLQYEIKEGNTIVYETNAIKPGNMVEADLYSLLPQGEHSLTFTISSYDVETQAVCNGATQSVMLLVK